MMTSGDACPTNEERLEVPSGKRGYKGCAYGVSKNYLVTFFEFFSSVPVFREIPVNHIQDM